MIQNKIGLGHIAATLMVQIIVGLITGNYWYGVFFSSFFIGREFSQAEYRWIEKYGNGLRANMPWWGRFDPKIWTLHSLTDWIFPVIFSVLFASICVII